MKSSLKLAVALATAAAVSQLAVQASAAEPHVAAANAAVNQPVPIVIARRVPLTAQDLAKYRKLAAGSQNLRTAGADDAESWLIIGVAAFVVGGVILYSHLYHTGVNGMGTGGGGY
jgi:hypothetical protein